MAPAHPGDTMVLWGTGFGRTDPTVAAGAVVSGDPAAVTAPVTTVGGTQLKVISTVLTAFRRVVSGDDSPSHWSAKQSIGGAGIGRRCVGPNGRDALRIESVSLAQSPLAAYTLPAPHHHLLF